MAGKPSMKTGDCFITKYGTIIVLDYRSAKDVDIVFENTGFVKTVEAADIRKNNVKDPMSPSVRGVGIIGVGPFKVSVNRKATREYNHWTHMIRRCYDPEYHKLKPTYIGCTVCDRWLNFQNFCEDLPNLPGYSLFSNEQPCHSDKDIRVYGNKIYSPDTCMFATPSENSSESYTRNKRNKK